MKVYSIMSQSTPNPATTLVEIKQSRYVQRGPPAFHIRPKSRDNAGLAPSTLTFYYSLSAMSATIIL